MATRQGRFGFLATGALVMGLLVATSPVPDGGASSANAAETYAPVPAPPQDGSSELSGIACPAVGSCIAVGQSGATENGAIVIDTLAAGAWTEQALTPPGLALPALSSIWCASITSCIAVGLYGVNTTFGLVETLSGSSWTPTTAGLELVGDSNVTLVGLWCSSLTSCVAVGGYQDPSGDDHVLVDTLSGTTWTATNEPDGAAQSDPILYSVQCASSTSCLAVGSSDQGGILDTLSGTMWTATLVATSGDGFLSLWCGATDVNCTAVGSDTNGDLLVDTLSGGTWTRSVLTVPGLSGGFGDLSAVSCTDATDCVALGVYEVPGQTTADLVAETLSGSTWTPDVLALNDSLPFVGALACPSISSCIGVGSSFIIDVEAQDVSLQPEFFELLPIPTTPIITNLPGGGTVGQGFTASVSTNSDGTTSVSSLTPTDCTASGLAVSYLATGPCTLVAQVAGTSTDAPGSGSPQTFTISAPAAPKHGFWLVGTDGGIFTFGSAQFWGSTGSIKLNKPVVGITPSPDEGGYRLVASDGGLFAFGDAKYLGSIPELGLLAAGSPAGTKHLNAPIVGMVPTADGQGYFMVGADGGVFAFGDAKYEGSCPGIGGCGGTAVGVAPDSTGNGYWLVTSTGSVYAFGDAPYFNGPGPRSSAITSIVRAPLGPGYWILDADGNVYSYGQPGLGALPQNAAGGLDPATAIFSTSSGGGYWVVTTLGKVYAFGDAPNVGDVSGTHLNGSIIAATGF